MSFSEMVGQGDEAQPAVGELLERARAATERQQLDLADHYFCLAAQQHASRVTKETVLDHASVLLLLGESERAATLAASLADPRQMSSFIFEWAIYMQGAAIALLQADDHARSKAALERGLAVSPHSQQVRECRASHSARDAQQRNTSHAVEPFIGAVCGRRSAACSLRVLLAKRKEQRGEGLGLLLHASVVRHGAGGVGGGLGSASCSRCLWQ